MDTRADVQNWLKGNPDMIAVCVRMPEWPDARWGIVRACNLDTYRELFPDHEIVEIVRADAAESA